MIASYYCEAENIEIFSDTKIIWMGQGVYAEHVIYIPIVMEDGRVGYCIHGLYDGEQEFLYLNPSTGTDDGVPNVFIYQDFNNEPGLAEVAEASDGGTYHYVVADGFAKEPVNPD